MLLAALTLAACGGNEETAGSSDTGSEEPIAFETVETIALDYVNDPSNLSEPCEGDIVWQPEHFRRRFGGSSWSAMTVSPRRPAIARANMRLAREDRPLIPDLTPHSLRHTYRSLLIAEGVDIATVAAQMRHADATTTLRVYTHVMKHRREEAAGRLEAAIAGRKEVASEPREERSRTG